MSGRRVFSMATVSIFGGVFTLMLASVQLGCSQSPDADRVTTIASNDDSSDKSGASLIGRWRDGTRGGHENAGIVIHAGEETGRYHVELTFSHCLGTQVATREAQLQDDRLVLDEPFTYNDLWTNLGIDHNAPASERQGIDAFKVLRVNNASYLIPAHYFDGAIIHHVLQSQANFEAHVHRDWIDDPKRLARLPSDRDFEITELNSIFYKLRF